MPDLVTCVVHIEQQAAVDVDKLNGVLVVVGDAAEANSIRKRDPLSVRQDLYNMAFFAEAAFYPSSYVIGKEDRLADHLVQRGRMQVIRVAVGEPDKFTFANGLQLFFWNGVFEDPTAEIGTGTNQGSVVRTGALS